MDPADFIVEQAEQRGYERGKREGIEEGKRQATFEADDVDVARRNAYFARGIEAAAKWLENDRRYTKLPNDMRAALLPQQPPAVRAGEPVVDPRSETLKWFEGLFGSQPAPADFDALQSWAADSKAAIGWLMRAVHDEGKHGGPLDTCVRAECADARELGRRYPE